MTLPEDKNHSTDEPRDNSGAFVIKTVPVSQQTGKHKDGAALPTENPTTFDFYSCEEAIKRLNEYLDSELAPEERDDVLKHLNVCGPCLERFHFEKSLIVSLRDKVKRTIAPLNLRERLAVIIKSNGR